MGPLPPKFAEVLSWLWGCVFARAGTAAVVAPPSLNLGHLLHFYFQRRDVQRFFFVEVGAHDGKANDALYEYAMRLNLRGILIEPQPDVFEKLKQNYKDNGNVLFENVAVSDEDGPRQLYTIRKDLDFLRYANQAASFDYRHIARLLQQHLQTTASDAVRRRYRDLGLTVANCIVAETVVTSTLRTILDKHGVADFDLLQIDAEGCDYEILKTVDFERHRPSMVMYEHEHLDADHQLSAWAYLRAAGYEVCVHQGNTAAFPIESASAPWPGSEE